MRDQWSFVKLRKKPGGIRRWANACLCAWFLLLCAAPLRITAADAPDRVIHVVYDDSGSMFRTGGVLVDTWCQAKYSMEVFAAMLGEADRMNIYYMSDYENGTAAGPRLQLDGGSGAEVNVERVHAEKTVAGNTPFNAVTKAYSDLDAADANEKWLIILTDGEFQGVNGQEGIDAFLARKSEDINVMFLGMGAGAGGITPRPNNGIFYVEAQTSRIAYEYYKECWGAEGLRMVKDVGEKWVFYPNVDVPVFGDHHISIQKSDGEIKPFVLPDKHNFELLKSAVSVEVPEEFT